MTKVGPVGLIVPDWPRHNRWHLHGGCPWHRWGVGRNAIGQVAIWTPVLVVLLGSGGARQRALREYHKAEGYDMERMYGAEVVS